jgi:RHS repeat-associated protein
MSMQHIPHLLIAAALVTSTALSAAQTLPPPPVSPVPVVNYEYDAQGNPTKTVAAPAVPGLNLQTTQTYDRLDRPVDQTDPRLGKTQFKFDGQDSLTQVTDPRNLVTQYPRDGLGNPLKRISPDTGTATHTFDTVGNLKTRLDSRGVKTTYTVDALDRVTATVYSQTGQSSQSYTNTYDQTGAGYAYGIGRLTSTNSPAGSTQYQHDPRGRILLDTQRIKPSAAANPAQISKTVTYTVDGAGVITSITYPSGRRLNINTVQGQAQSLSLSNTAAATAATPILTGIQWEPFGPPSSWQWPTNTGSQANDKIYDLSGRMVRYRMVNTIRDLTYDGANRITKYTHYNATTAAPDPALDQSFQYNENSQLTQITTASASWSIAYDANGNRTSVTLNGQTSAYTTTATSNKLTATTNPANTYTQDTAGNTTSDTAKAYTAVYDLSGRLSTVTKAGTTTTYHYDGFGRRIRKYNSTGPASTLVFIYDQMGQLLGEYDSTGKPLREYIWLGTTPVAMFTPDPANPAAGAAPLIYTIHADHLNTPRIVTDKNAKIRWRHIAEPFGTTAPETNPENLGQFTQNLRFPGQYFDQESGLNYNWHRDYDPSTGRYVESDPIGLDGGINTFSYVGGNPIGSIDPEGLAGCKVLFPDYPVEYADGKTSTWLGGHGGVLTYDENGVTEYFEYGRYSPGGSDILGVGLPTGDGNIRRVSVPRITLEKDGQPTKKSWVNLLDKLSKQSGHGTRPVLTCDAEADEKKIAKYANKIANDRTRAKYNWNPLNSNQCRDFSKRAFSAGQP